MAFLNSSYGQDAISLNLSGSASYDMTATDVAGFIPTANWNNLNATSGSTTFTTIEDDTGATTGASITLKTSPYSYNNNTVLDGTGHTKMMGSAKGTSQNGQSRAVEVSGSPYSTVDVYVYFGAAGSSATTPYTMNVRLQEPDGSGGWTDVGPTYYMTDTNKVWSGTYERSTATSAGSAADEKNFVLFENVSLTDFRISASSVNRRSGFTGVQIISAAQSSGDVIALNLSGTAAYDMSASDTAGVVSSANWNNLNSTSGSTTFNTIKDQSGATTSASVTLKTSPYSYNNNTTLDGSGDAKMMGSSKGTSQSGQGRAVEVANSPYSLVDVYVYFGAAGSNATTPYTMNVKLQEPDGSGGWTDVGVTYYMTDNNKSWSGTYERSTATSTGTAATEKNYVLFEDVSLTDFRITATSVSRRSGFTGVQIVDVSGGGGSLITKYYMTPNGAGLNNGSNFQNAYAYSAFSQTQLNTLLNTTMQPGDELYLGSGSYHGKLLKLISDGELGNTKKIIGVDNLGTGRPILTKGVWSRVDPDDDNYSLITATDGSVSHWEVSGLDLSGAVRAIHMKNYSTPHNDITFRDINISNVRHGLYAWNLDDSKIENVTITNYTKHAFRLESGCNNTEFISCLADLADGDTSWWDYSEPIPYGFLIEDGGTSNPNTNITFTDCVSMNNRRNGQSSGVYWNGDGFGVENNNTGTTFIRCFSSDNDDGGYDIKAASTLQDCVGVGNKRNFRTWSGSSTLTNCISLYPFKRGGDGSSDCFWTKNGTPTANFCTAHSDGGTSFREEGTGTYLHGQ